MDTDKSAESRTTIAMDVVDRNRNPVGNMDLDASVFDAPVKTHLLHEVVVYQEAKHRAGTGSTKRRGEVSGSNAKPYRQKGTGRARAGERTSPLRKGGGVIFGPKPRDFSVSVPKKVRKAALKSALSAKRREDKLLLVDELDLERIKTRDLVDWLEGLGIESSALVVIAEKDEKVMLSARNLKGVKVVVAEGANVRDVLLHDLLVITRGAAEKIQEALS